MDPTLQTATQMGAQPTPQQLLTIQGLMKANPGGLGATPQPPAPPVQPTMPQPQNSPMQAPGIGMASPPGLANAQMPGMGQDPDLMDQQIMQLMNSSPTLGAPG